MPFNSAVTFDPVSLLEKAANGAKRVTFREGEAIFAYGDDADAVFYIEHGVVKKTCLSYDGKERVVDLLKRGAFFGIGCLVGRQKRGTAAMAMTPCSAIRIEKRVMLQLLCGQPDLADMVISFLVDQTNRYKRELVDHMFNPSEKRLVRALLALSELGESDGEKTTLPRISQESLAEIVGTTASRISYFMKKFRQQGVIEYDGRIQVSYSRLNVLLGDDAGRLTKGSSAG